MDLSDKSSRFELKYRINHFQYHKLKTAIIPFMRKDYYTQRTPESKYLVRSLYYDTYDYSSYHEKMDGDCDRIKFRIRTYSEEIKENTQIKVELKVRRGNLMIKYTSSISPSAYLFFHREKRWEDEQDPVLCEFLRYIHMRQMTPQVLVEYMREGYEDRSNIGLRVTFDHAVKSSGTDYLFPGKEAFFRHHIPHSVIFELKCRNERPKWITNLIRDHGLRLIANSKFTQGITASRNDLFHPDGVVLIR